MAFQVAVILFTAQFSLSCAHATGVSSYSFIYNYGNAKLWAFIETDMTLTVSAQKNSSIFLTFYLEKTEDNRSVFLNRISLKLRETQLEKTLSPNITLQHNTESWSCNIIFEEEDVSQILKPGQTLQGELDFEFRYDIFDTNNNVWSYRINEDFPIGFANVKEVSQPWLNFESLFITLLICGVSSAIFLFWLRVHRYKKSAR